MFQTTRLSITYPQHIVSPGGSILSSAVIPWVLLIVVAAAMVAQPRASEGSRIRTVHIKAMKFRFVPDRISVKQGETLKLEITSKDVEHSFRISMLGMDYPIDPGKTTEVVFKPESSGQIQADCGVFCGTGHKQMKLTINKKP